MYLIKFTVRKTITWYGGLGASCPTAFHKIAVWIFNWNCKRLLTALLKPYNSWAFGDWGWVDFAAIRSFRETYIGSYRPLWVSISYKIGNPTATLVSVDETRKGCFLKYTETAESDLDLGRQATTSTNLNMWRPYTLVSALTEKLTGIKDRSNWVTKCWSDG